MRRYLKEKLSQEEKDALKKIKIRMDEEAVHVSNDQTLKKFMGIRLKKALMLAMYIKWNYKKEFEKTLQITTMSLAVELIAHFVVQEICLFGKKYIIRFLPGKKILMKACDAMIGHMEIIDCGSLEFDNNRFIWDILAKPTGFLWGILN